MTGDRPDISKKINQRTATRIQTSSVIKRIEKLMLEETVTSTKLLGLKNNLVSKLEQLNSLNDEVINLLEPEEVENDVLESMEFSDPTHELLAEISEKLQSLSVSSTGSEPLNPIGSSSVKSVSSRCRLPKFELPVFKGDPLSWQGFWDQFNTSIHENDEITDIDRFNYLKRYLGGQALETVSGLSLSKENYNHAIVTLRERFGNPQVLISSHMDRLINMNKVSNKNDTLSLRKLYNGIENCTRNLSALKLDISAYGSLLIPILKNKLPVELNMTIARRFGSDIWTLERLMNFFNDELTAIENCKTPNAVSSEKSYYDKRGNNGNDFTSSCLHGQFSNEESHSKARSCLFCNARDHLASRCNSVTNVVARKNILRKQGRCFVCLDTGHLMRNCQSKYSCKKCKKRHNISICDTNGNTPEVQHNNFVSSYNGVLMQTASAECTDVSNFKTRKTRILFDSGSQRSYVSLDLCSKLSLQALRKERVNIKTFGDDDWKIRELEVFQMKIKHRNGNGFCLIEAYGVPKVCGPLTKQDIEFTKKRYTHIECLGLADRNIAGKDLEVNVLIGLDFYHDFFTGNRETGLEGPVALETRLGWVLSGRYESSPDDQHCFTTQHILRVDVEKEKDSLREELRKFWEVESTCSKGFSVIDDFQNHILHDGSRYVTKLPFKPDHDRLPDNYLASERRLRSNIKRLNSNELYEEYREIINSYERDGIIEKVPINEVNKESGEVHYLPHRAVVKEDRLTTKIRIVFDASCKVKGVPSLNDCLYSGPNLLCKIYDILFRFRLNKIAVVADIKQAFLNVGINKEHQDFLRFLWIENDDVVIYRFLRVVFGLTSSPFLLNGTIRQHLEKYRDRYPDVIERLSEDLYVDDTTTGWNSVEEGKKFFKVAMEVMDDAGLELRKWMSNNNELQQFFERGKECEKIISDDTTFAKEQVNGETKNGRNKVLGLEWDRDYDCLVFDFTDFIARSKSIQPTKRNILSLSASIYDPIGIISPITAQVKSLFQCLCVDKSGWDDVVTGELNERWIDLLQKIESLKVVRIPRFSFVDVNEASSAELHGFCDSSKTLYCAVIYVRVLTESGVKVFFWTSKTKVSPLKVLTIPRLELLGCVLLSELIKDVNRSIGDRILIKRTVCWTDSTVALCWIEGKEKSWKPWVENRVVDVRKVVDRDKWFHIPGILNPADKPTRTVEDFVSLFSGVWFSGPSFLSDEAIVYESKPQTLTTEAKEELKTSTDETNVFTVTERKAIGLNEIVDVSRYATLSKLINIVAYILRFKKKLFAKIRQADEDTDNNDKELTADERRRALDLLIQEEQQAMTNTTKFHKTKANLNAFEDEDGVWRLKGRFGESTMTEDEKQPILLQSVSWLTTLVVRNAHQDVLHFGVETTLAKIRERFWIIRGRNVVKNVLKKCVTCKRYQGRTMKPPGETNLPGFRVNHLSSAFSTTGLDYAGPLFVRNKGLSSKVYILLFTCASSRAIHLELTPDMKSPAFLRAFKRFSSRRGKPDEIINDNFKTFKSSEVKSFMSRSNVHQRFILPASPWWGGFYERLVRSVKTSLKKILKRALVTFEELQTILCEIESVINSRPLCYTSNDDINASITPNHLIFGRNLNVPSTTPFSDDINAIDCTKRIDHLKSLLSHFWKRFNSTYLNELRQRHIYERKQRSMGAELKLNDVVLVKDDIPTPRSKWRIGKVEKLIIGKDGQVRGAKLKMANESGKTTIAHRPVQKLIPFEIAETKEPIPVLVPEMSSSGVARDENHKEGRIRRRAAIEGQTLRRLKENII